MATTFIYAQGGDTGIIQAMKDAAHPWVPFGGALNRGVVADFTGDGTVDGADLGELLGAWGECP